MKLLILLAIFSLSSLSSWAQDTCFTDNSAFSIKTYSLEVEMRKITSHMKNNCNNWNMEEWTTFVKKTSSSFDGNSKKLFKSKDFLSVIKNCSNKIDRNPKIKACMGNLSYLFSLTFNSGNFSKVKQDPEYLKSQPKDVVDLPIEFKNGLPENWKEVALKKGWKYVHFNSSLESEGEDGKEDRRLVFYIQDKDVKKFVMFFHSGSNPLDSKGIQMQVYENKSDNRVHYRDYTIDKQRKKVSLNEHSQGGSCISCHVGGPRKIFPDKKHLNFPTTGNTTLKDFNRYLREFSNPNFDLSIDKKKHSSMMDSIYSVDIEKVSNKKYSKDSIKAANKCINCHDGYERGHLLPFIDGDQMGEYTHIYYNKVMDGSMPPKSKLSLQEKDEVVDLLFKQQVEGMRKWLQEVPCH